MEYEKIIEFPVFGYNIYAVYTEDIQTSRDKRANLIGALDEVLLPTVDGMHSYNKLNTEGWIFFTPFSSTGTIAHECFHALWQMFEYFGANLENEIVAYHLGYLLDIILDFKMKVDYLIANPEPIKKTKKKLTT